MEIVSAGKVPVSNLLFGRTYRHPKVKINLLGWWQSFLETKVLDSFGFLDDFDGRRNGFDELMELPKAIVGQPIMRS